MQISTLVDLTKITDSQTFMRYASQTIQAIINSVNGRLEFDKNMLSQTVKVTFPSAGTAVKVSHKLNKTGVNYLVASKSVACDIYRGTGDTTSTISLVSTAAASVTLILV